MHHRDSRSSRSSSACRTNDQIRSPRVVLIDHEGVNHGEIASQEAKRRADDANLDLVEVQPGDRESGRWPVCKIMDYGKMRYEQSKKKQKKKAPALKEIMFHYRTAEHDLSIKRKQIEKFLSKGHQVKFGIVLKGREQRFKADAKQILEEQIGKLEQVAKTERIMESGRMIHATLSPKQ
jgi:translation initiation factor IF-3